MVWIFSNLNYFRLQRKCDSSSFKFNFKMSGCFILLFDHIDGKKKLVRVGSREEEEELGIGQNVENQNVENHKERQKISSVCRKSPFK